MLGHLGQDDGSVRALRRMKWSASGLLAFAAAVFLISFALPNDLAVGYLRAGAEAGMVGGLADWFAVTALFRHPLGLRIPHTALVPRQKDALATKLGEFVTGNFLTSGALSQQVAESRLVRRLATLLAEPATSASLSREISEALSAALGSLDETTVTEYLLELARRDLSRRSYTPVLGQLLTRAVEGQAQRPLVDVLISKSHRALAEQRHVLLPWLKRWLEGRGALAWLWASDKRVNGLLDAAIETLAAAENNPHDLLRVEIDRFLAAFAEQLRTDAGTAASLDNQLRALLDNPRLTELLRELVADGLVSIRTSLREGGSALDDRIASLIRDVGNRVLIDPLLEARLERALQDTVSYAAEHYGDAVVSLIRRTVAQWEARDASRRIELAVGRDLQFIRINGTVVGAVAGLALHVVAVALG